LAHRILDTSAIAASVLLTLWSKWQLCVPTAVVFL